MQYRQALADLSSSEDRVRSSLFVLKLQETVVTSANTQFPWISCLLFIFIEKAYVTHHTNTTCMFKS
jgi:hypothetical protein